MSQRYVLIEALEDRRFLSATLAPSAVEGTYTGTATEKGTGSEAFTVKITATTETVTITGYGSESIKLSAAAFKKLRAGTFSYSGKIKAISVSPVRHRFQGRQSHFRKSYREGHEDGDRNIHCYEIVIASARPG